MRINSPLQQFFLKVWQSSIKQRPTILISNNVSLLDAIRRTVYEIVARLRWELEACVPSGESHAGKVYVDTHTFNRD